jgi:hypothetical protein
VSQSLQDRFPDLYFDTKTVEEKTPKKNPPSIAQIMDKILVVNGIQNSGLAGDLGQAATDFFAAAPAKMEVSEP